MSEWQPIETAPKDGTRILAWVIWPGDSITAPHALIDVVEWFDGGDNPYAAPAGWDGRFVGSPALWQALPEPPTP